MSEQLDRLRETREVLADRAAMCDLADDTEPEVVGVEAVRALVDERVSREFL